MWKAIGAIIVAIIGFMGGVISETSGKACPVTATEQITHAGKPKGPYNKKEWIEIVSGTTFCHYTICSRPPDSTGSGSNLNLKYRKRLLLIFSTEEGMIILDNGCKSIQASSIWASTSDDTSNKNTRHRIGWKRDG